MKPQDRSQFVIPADTSHAARAVYSNNNFFLVVGDYLEVLLGSTHQNGFHPSGLISRRETPHLTMVTIFQFNEKLSDDQAVEATRIRLDWKYALHLSINYSGLPATTLCEYRQWVMQEPDRQERFQLILDRLVEMGLPMGSQKQPFVTTTVLDGVCSVTRLDLIFKAMRRAIEALATYQPEWLRKAALPHWYDRYHRLSSILKIPSTKEEQEALARSFGADAKALLEAYQGFPPQGLALTDVLALEEVLYRHFESQNEELSWRTTGCAYCQKNRPGRKEYAN